MDSLSSQIIELEKRVKGITRSKQKKHVSAETMQHFKKVLAGIDDLNKDVLKYNGTNIFLYAKLNNNEALTNYVQY